MTRKIIFLVAGMKRPNIVMIVADQWRADSISYTGNTTTVTPNIDSLVEDGVGFSNAYCQLPVCVPSRSSFLSGWYPHTKGFRTMHHLMGEEDPNILKTLKKKDITYIGADVMIFYVPMLMLQNIVLQGIISMQNFSAK